MPGKDVMLDRYLQYNLWANLRLVENIRSVDADLVTNVALAPFGGVIGVLRHIVGAQNIWLQRARGESPTDFMGFTDGKNLHDLCEMLISTSEAWIAFATQHPEALKGAITYATTTGDQFTQTMSDVVMHVVNHGTYHRGQVMSALRSVYDGKLQGLDLIAFARQ